MYETSDFKNGLKLEIEGIPYEITYFQHVKPGKGNAFTRTKLRSLLDGKNLEITFKSGDVFKKADVDQKKCQYLYKEDESYVFMDNTNYEQFNLEKPMLGDAVHYMQDNMIIDVVFFNGKPVGVELPFFVELKVASVEPGLKGDTASGGATKPATLETGYNIQVPLYIVEGEKIKIDTRTGKFYERAKS